MADGAGTASRADEGARHAVESVVGALVSVLENNPTVSEEIWKKLMTEAFLKARDGLLSLSKRENEELRSFATTLSCVICSQGWLVVANLGDTAVVVEDIEESLFTIARPRRGEYANETYFLTQDEAIQQVEIHAHRFFAQALGVTTDGLIRLATILPEYTPHPAFFRQVFAFAAEARDLEQAQQELTDFLNSDRVCERTDDDKTLVLAVRTNFAPIGLSD